MTYLTTLQLALKIQYDERLVGMITQAEILTLRAKLAALPGRTGEKLPTCPRGGKTG